MSILSCSIVVVLVQAFLYALNKISGISSIMYLLYNMVAGVAAGMHVIADNLSVLVLMIHHLW